MKKSFNAGSKFLNINFNVIIIIMNSAMNEFPSEKCYFSENEYFLET